MGVSLLDARNSSNNSKTLLPEILTPSLKTSSGDLQLLLLLQGCTGVLQDAVTSPLGVVAGGLETREGGTAPLFSLAFLSNIIISQT